MDALGLTEQLASHVIRPPRATYSLEDLGTYSQLQRVEDVRIQGDCLRACRFHDPP